MVVVDLLGDYVSSLLGEAASRTVREFVDGLRRAILLEERWPGASDYEWWSQGYFLYTAIVLVFVSWKNASGPPSRPKPDCFMPPNGPLSRGKVPLIAMEPV